MHGTVGVDGLDGAAGHYPNSDNRRADVQTTHTLKASLADVFIEVTGRRLA